MLPATRTPEPNWSSWLCENTHFHIDRYIYTNTHTNTRTHAYCTSTTTWHTQLEPTVDQTHRGYHNPSTANTPEITWFVTEGLGLITPDETCSAHKGMSNDQSYHVRHGDEWTPQIIRWHDTVYNYTIDYIAQGHKLLASLHGDCSTEGNKLAGKRRMHCITLPFP